MTHDFELAIPSQVFDLSSRKRLPPYLLHSGIFALFAFYYMEFHYSAKYGYLCKYFLPPDYYNYHYMELVWWTVRFGYFCFIFDVIISFVRYCHIKSKETDNRPFELIISKYHLKCGFIFGILVTALAVYVTKPIVSETTNEFPHMRAKFPSPANGKALSTCLIYHVQKKKEKIKKKAAAKKKKLASKGVKK